MNSVPQIMSLTGLHLVVWCALAHTGVLVPGIWCFVGVVHHATDLGVGNLVCVVDNFDLVYRLDFCDFLDILNILDLLDLVDICGYCVFCMHYVLMLCILYILWRWLCLDLEVDIEKIHPERSNLSLAPALPLLSRLVLVRLLYILHHVYLVYLVHIP